MYGNNWWKSAIWWRNSFYVLITGWMCGICGNKAYHEGFPSAWIYLIAIASFLYAEWELLKDGDSL